MTVQEPRTHDLSVPDITCDHCKSSIESAVGALAEVDSVEVNVEAKTVHVVGGSHAAIVSAIDDIGFEVA